MKNMENYSAEERFVRLDNKKIYIPNQEELQIMQEMGANVYKYLYVKAIELFTLEGLVLYKKGILNDNYKYFLNDPDIVRAVCRMYPEEIRNTEYARFDHELCLDLISGEDRTIYGLDELRHFSSAVLGNSNVVSKVIQILYKNLMLNPKYRFEYYPSDTLNSIFSGHILDEQFCYKEMLQQLSVIEPAYLLKACECYGIDRIGLLRSSISDYASRYGIASYFGEEYRGKDIFANPDQNVKRLVKAINKRRNYTYNQSKIGK